MKRKKEKYIPFVIEPSLGADRVVLAFLCGAYDEGEYRHRRETGYAYSSSFPSALAPVKIGVLHYPRNWVRKQKLSMQNFPRTGTANMTTEAISVSDTEDRMKSAHHSVLLMISIPKKMAA